jgi:predicted esterase
MSIARAFYGRLLFAVAILSWPEISKAWDAFDHSVNPFPPTPKFGELFRVQESAHSDGNEVGNTSFLFVPKQLDAGRTYPLIIWLHGLGEVELKQPFGALNWMSELIFTDPGRLDKYQFFVLAPRCTDRRGWIGTGYLPSSAEAIENGSADSPVVEYFLDEALKRYPIDRQRISLAGISAGAAAASYWAYMRPDRFSAVALMAGGEIPSSMASAPRTSIWMFANRDDEDYPLAAALEVVSTTNDMGGQAYLTVLPQKGHNVWNSAFLGDYRLLNWLLTKSTTDTADVNVPSGPYTERITRDNVRSFRAPSDPITLKLHLAWLSAKENVYSLIGLLLLISLAAALRWIARRAKACHH